MSKVGDEGPEEQDKKPDLRVVPPGPDGAIMKLLAVTIEFTDGKAVTYKGETFGASLEFQGFTVIGFLDPLKPLHLVKTELIKVIKIQEFATGLKRIK